MAVDSEFVRGESVVAVMDFHMTRIYPVEATPKERSERITAIDPRGRFHEVHHRAGNPDGTYEADNPEYWREVTEALASARAILLLGHGKGKANATHHWVVYVETHRKDVAAKIVGDLRLDIDDLDEAQVFQIARHFFAAPTTSGAASP